MITLLAAACSDLGPPVCTLNVVPAVVVEVRDSVSGQPVAEGARGVVRDGAFADSLRPFQFHGDTLVSFSAADERAGTYEVTVERAGYLTWRIGSVEVADAECHVETAELLARLRPEP